VHIVDDFPEFAIFCIASPFTQLVYINHYGVSANFLEI
jgi:hypothetical protein